MTRRKYQAISLRALKTTQGPGTQVFSFFIPGGDIMRVADISRIARDDHELLRGFQRKEIQSHVRGIVDYLDKGNVLFPNAIILAFSPDVVFKHSRGPSPQGVADFSQIGTLTIPVREEGKRAAWIVDGQQRSIALSKTSNSDIKVPVVGFISGDLEMQREQFILVNKARPLPVRLINELLPEIGTQLPRDLTSRKIPSELCNVLDRDPRSPFHRLIKRMSKDDHAGAVIVDTALIQVIKRSLSNPIGALSMHRGGAGEPSDVDGMYRTMCIFWAAVRDEYPEAWAKPPTESRLMHSAGILAMGVLMDRMMARAHGSSAIRAALKRISPYCCWTSGTWDGLGLRWNEIQNVPKHVRALSDLLVKLDFTLSQKAA